MVKIEVGKSYRTRDGRKVTCHVIGCGSIAYLTTETNYFGVWANTGRRFGNQQSPFDIISEWKDDEPQSPVRERVIREIVPGTYGKFSLNTYTSGSTEKIGIFMNDWISEPTELRDIAKMLLDIADVLEENEG